MIYVLKIYSDSRLNRPVSGSLASLARLKSVVVITQNTIHLNNKALGRLPRTKTTITYEQLLVVQADPRVVFLLLLALDHQTLYLTARSG